MFDSQIQTNDLRCPKCKRRLTEAEVLCDGCGWDVDPALAREAALVHRRQRQKKRRIRMAKWHLLRLALLLIGILAIAVVIYVVLETVNEKVVR